jgi:RNA polymerase sigma factor (TIGR02999 family)
MVERLMSSDAVSSSSDITALLKQWSAGDASARDRLVPLVYERLRQLAHQRRRGAGDDSSLTTTALVHETYMRLVDAPNVALVDRAQFLALAAQVMRNLLIDHARERRAAKRGGGAAAVELREEFWLTDADADALLELHVALERLATLDSRQSQILEHRYFGGLSLEETASVVGVSLATVKRELRSARAWLALTIKGESLG